MNFSNSLPGLLSSSRVDDMEDTPVTSFMEPEKIGRFGGDGRLSCSSNLFPRMLDYSFERREEGTLSPDGE